MLRAACAHLPRTVPDLVPAICTEVPLPLGDWFYRTRVPREVQVFAEDEKLSLPDTYVDSGEAPPYYPDSLRAFLLARPNNGNGGNAHETSAETQAEPVED